MTRVVQVINGLDGGAGRGLLEVLPRLDASRFRTEVLCLFKEGHFAAGLRAVGIPVRHLGLRPGVSVGHARSVFRSLRELRPDIVHAQLPEAAWIGLPAAWAAGVRVRIAHLRNCHKSWRGKVRVFDRLMAAFATQTVACSDAVRRFYEGEVHYRGVQVVLNPVDTSRFRDLPERRAARTALGLPPDAVILACVAVLKPAKCHLGLLEALRAIRTSRPDVCLLLVGDGAERRALEHRASELGLGDSVRFLGWRSDVPPILAACDLLVMASSQEGLPLAVLEAGAARMPVVATDVGGVGEAVEDGVTGLLVPPRDPDRFGETVLRLLDSPERMHEMGRRACARVQEHFAVELIVGQWEALYERLLAGRPRVTERGNDSVLAR